MSSYDKKFIIITAFILIAVIAAVWTWIFSVQRERAEEYAVMASSQAVKEAERLAAAESKAAEPKKDYKVPPIVAPKKNSSSSKSTTKDGEVIVSKPDAPEPPKVKDEAQLTDPTKKPEYPKKDTDTSSSDAGTGGKDSDTDQDSSSSKPDDSPSNTTPPKQSAPKNGDRKIVNGQEYIYDAGFKEWFKPTGGVTKDITVNRGGEIVGY